MLHKILLLNRVFYGFLCLTTIKYEATATGTPSLTTYRPFPPAQFSGTVCRVIHVSPSIPTSVLSFIYTNTPSRTVQTHLTIFSITLFQLTSSALGIPEYRLTSTLGG